MTRRVLGLSLCLSSLLVAGCSKSIDGPTPSLTSLQNERAPTLQPGVVCNAQGDPTNGWPVDVLGSNFSPMPTGVLTSKTGVALPTIALAGPEAYTLDASRVYFRSARRLIAAFPTDKTTPAKSLMPGEYDVTVTNPNGHSAKLAKGLTVVPPPTVTGVTLTTPVTQTQDGAVEIDGTNFRPGQPPAVEISGLGLPTVSLPNVQVASATAVTATVPANTAEGTYDVTVTNPEGCAFTLPGALTISYHALGRLALDPRFGWQLKNQPVTISNTVTTAAENPFTPGTAQVWISAPLKGAPGTTVDIPLRRIAYVSPGVITAVVPDCSGTAATPTSDATCPAGIAPGGPYTVHVKDPSGAIGQLSGNNGFSVVTDPPPTVTQLNPTSITTTGTSNLVITGTGFSSGNPSQAGKAQIGFQTTGGTEFCDLPLHAGGTVSATELDVDVPTSIAATSCTLVAADGSAKAATSGFAIGTGLYLIRVQHTADVASGDYSGLIVTSTSYNPVAGPAISTLLAEPLMDFPLVEASDDLGAHFLYALGGANGSGATASVERGAISKFGDVGGTCTGSPAVCRFLQLDRSASPNAHQGQLPVGPGQSSPIAITGATAVARSATEPCGSATCTTSYVFLLGGEDGSGQALATVYRAQVLRNADAPVVDDTAAASTAAGSLAAGTYYYRVSAITPASDAANPGGETLPSDEAPGQLTAAGTLTARWACLPGVTQYKVYRTVNPNDPAGTEKLLDTVNANCAGSPLAQSYADDGGKTPSGDAPLPSGALGAWVPQVSLLTARSHARARLVGDDLFVAGGSCTAGSTGCTTAGDLATVEHITFTPGTADFADAAFGLSGTLQTARSDFDGLLAITHENAPKSVPAGTTYLLAVGGSSGGAVITGNGTNVLEMSAVAAGGITTWSTPTFPTSMNGTIGGWAEVQADNFFVEGLDSLGSLFNRSTTGGICKAGHPCPTTGIADFDFSVNAGFPLYQLPSSGFPRYRVGETLFRAYIYAAGGASSKAGTTLTDTLERYVY